jgi:hypothetical protein
MSFQNLYRSSPSELKQIIMDQWKAKQNPSHHPEGNTLKHIIVVTNRAFKNFPDNKDIQLAAYFHDLGKLATYDINPKTGQPTAYGHEEKSVELIDEFSNFVQQQGANPEIVKYIVKNHMKIKPNTWDVMKPSKKDPIVNNPHYQDLEKFGTIDKGGLLEFAYLYQNNNKMAQLISEVKRMQFLAGLITESQMNENTKTLSPEDQKIVDDILESLNEGMFDKNKLISYLKKGAITAAIIGSLLASTQLNSNQKKDIVDTIKQEQVDQDLGNIADARLAISRYEDKIYKPKIDKAAENDFDLQQVIKGINNITSQNSKDNEDVLKSFGKNYKSQIEKLLKVN